MAENIKRGSSLFRDYFRRETIRGLLITAEKDPDRVSVMRLGNDGAIVVINEGAIAEVRSWDQLLGRVRSLVDEMAGLRDEAEDAATEQAELAQVDIDDLHRELERLRGVLRSAEPRAAEAEDRARAAEEAQRAAEQWVENLRDERDALRAEVDRLRGALERADEEMRSLVAERDALRAKLEAMATERARLVIAAYAVVEAAEKEVPSDDVIADIAADRGVLGSRA